MICCLTWVDLPMLTVFVFDLHLTLPLHLAFGRRPQNALHLLMRLMRLWMGSSQAQTGRALETPNGC